MDQRDKNSLNTLAYFGKRKFAPGFLVAYMVGGALVSLIVHFILEGGKLTTEWLWFSAITGMLVGAALYFWDLAKAKKA